MLRFVVKKSCVLNFLPITLYLWLPWLPWLPTAAAFVCASGAETVTEDWFVSLIGLSFFVDSTDSKIKFQDCFGLRHVRNGQLVTAGGLILGQWVRIPEAAIISDYYALKLAWPL